MPWLMTPFEGAQEVGGMKDVFNLHLSKGRQVIERAFGMMIKRWRILASSLDYSVDRCNRVIRVCALLHNMCLRSSLSKRIVVDRRTEAHHPFSQRDPVNGVVERVRLHVAGYRCPGTVQTEAEMHRVAEKKWSDAAATKRVLLSKRLFKKGNRRNAPRGANQCAAYQLSN
jgi:hypothetical protein